MKNKTLLVFLIFLINFFLIKLSYGQDQFNFNVSEIEILENGNKIIGSNGGKVSTDDGIIIEADNFIYRKNENVLIEGLSKRNSKELMGRTQNNRVVNFIGTNNLIGKIIPVLITDVKKHSLRGELI